MPRAYIPCRLQKEWLGFPALKIPQLCSPIRYAVLSKRATSNANDAFRVGSAMITSRGHYQNSLLLRAATFRR